MASTGLGIRQTNRPRLAASNRTEAEGASGGGRPEKRDLTSVGRPNRIEVAIHRGVNIVKRFRTKIVNANQSVIGAGDDVGDPAPVRRPPDLGRGALGVHQLRWFIAVVQTYRPNLVLAQENELVAR